MDEEAQYSVGSGDINPLALTLVLLGGFFLLSSSRQNGLKALLGVAILVPLGQQIQLAGLHFMFFRILIAVGMMRVVLRGELLAFHLNKIDKLFIFWALTEIVCGLCRGFKAEYLGMAYDDLGIYFLVRILTKEGEDVLGPLRFLCVVTLAVAAVMLVEAATKRNPFAVMGGVPIDDFIRNGKARAQGPFQHPIAAGAFGASIFPLMIGLWMQGGQGKKIAVGGIIGCLIIVFTSVSSGALMTLGAALIGLVLWRERFRMRRLRWLTVAGLVVISMIMKPPVYYLIAKVSDLAGGGGWHRSYLIDVCVHHFSSWWLTGDSYTFKWAPDYQATIGDPNNLDLTNYYISQCALGGIWMLGLFIAILTLCYSIVGRLVQSPNPTVWKKTFIWSFGVCLAAYCTTFISSSISNQSAAFWHWALAIVAGLPAYAGATDTAPDPVPEMDRESEANSMPQAARYN